MAIHDDKPKTDPEDNPLIHLADSINRSIIGDPKELTKGNWLTRGVAAVIIMGLLFYLFR